MQESEQPDLVDLRCDCDTEYFTVVDDQGELNASSAFAALSAVEYFERRVTGRTYDGSRLFLYQATRHRIAKAGRDLADSGADLRSTLKVLTHIGVPPEEYWPYNIESFRSEPSLFVLSLATPPKTLRYFRITGDGCDGDATWRALKSFLAAGFPVLFGFSVPSSLNDGPDIFFRKDHDAPRGGQSVVAVGYHLNRFGLNQDAILIRSSWGQQWGDNGYGWLPASFVRSYLARDFWCLISEDWLDATELSRPSIVAAVD
tara:strand:- start:32593 stop:33369 length:777 start_codon:yes stop_codon:yes gene_type:complete